MRTLLTTALLAATALTANAQLAIRGETVHTMAGPAIRDGIVLIRDGKIEAVGPSAEISVPDGFRILRGKVVTPGLVDAHTVVGLAGIYNVDADQDQLEPSSPIQPQLRAIDAYNADEDLIKWVRSFGVTTIHTGHGPGELVSGQTMVAKTVGRTVADATLVPARAVAVTLTSSARKSGKDSPGTRGKMISMLRSSLIEAREYAAKQAAAGDDDDKPQRDLKLETLSRVLKRELALMVTADKAQDILSAIRLAKEFDIELWLDSAAEAHVVLDEIKEAGCPVIVHPTMARATGERENMSFENAARLRKAGIRFVFQSGFEGYVPKTRVVLFEAAMAAANGLDRNAALAAITIEPANLLGVSDRVGSLAVGKDADVAIYDGDPFEYTTHCIGVVVNGQVVSEVKR